LQESQLFLQDCIKQLNGEKLDFVIFGGDQVETPGADDANWQLFVDCAQVLSCPWSFVLGEKDVSGTPPVNKMKMYGPDWKQKGIQTDKPYWSQSPLPGVHLIGLDTSRPESTAGDVSNEQLEWLKDDLHKNSGKFTIVFSHHPLLAPSPFDAGPPWDDYVTANGASVREILGGSKDVRLALNGHLHVNKVQQESAIWYVSSASLDVYPCSYKIFRITPQTIQMETYQVSYPALIKKAKQQLDGSTLAFKYNEQKPTAFADLAVGNRIDSMALLPLALNQPAQQIDEKKLKKAKEEQQKKEQAEAAKGDKGDKKKGKGDDKKDKKDEPKGESKTESKSESKSDKKSHTRSKKGGEDKVNKTDESKSEKVDETQPAKIDETQPAKTDEMPSAKSDEPSPSKQGESQSGNENEVKTDQSDKITSESTKSEKKKSAKPPKKEKAKSGNGEQSGDSELKPESTAPKSDSAPVDSKEVSVPQPEETAPSTK
jgi:hypothetical protein